MLEPAPSETNHGTGVAGNFPTHSSFPTRMAHGSFQRVNGGTTASSISTATYLTSSMSSARDERNGCSSSPSQTPNCSSEKKTSRPPRNRLKCLGRGGRIVSTCQRQRTRSHAHGPDTLGRPATFERRCRRAYTSDGLRTGGRREVRLYSLPSLN